MPAPCHRSLLPPAARLRRAEQHEPIRTHTTSSRLRCPRCAVSCSEPGRVLLLLPGPGSRGSLRLACASRGPARFGWGLDVLYAVCNSLYEEFKRDEYAPPPLIKRMVASGRLGRKTGRGFYEYSMAGAAAAA